MGLSIKSNFGFSPHIFASKACEHHLQMKKGVRGRVGEGGGAEGLWSPLPKASLSDPSFTDEEGRVEKWIQGCNNANTPPPPRPRLKVTSLIIIKRGSGRRQEATRAGQWGNPIKQGT